MDVVPSFVSAAVVTHSVLLVLEHLHETLTIYPVGRSLVRGTASVALV